MSHKFPPYNTQTVREWVKFQERYDVLWQTIHNGAVRMSWREKEPTQVYYFGLDVPPGRRLIVFNRELKVSEGLYDVEVVIPSSGFTGGTIAYKSQLNPGGATTVQSNLYGGVTPSGTLTVVDVDFVDTGMAIGAGRAGGAPAVEGVVAVITGKSLLRVTKSNADPYTVGIRLIAWEEDIPA